MLYSFVIILGSVQTTNDAMESTVKQMLANRLKKNATKDKESNNNELFLPVEMKRPVSSCYVTKNKEFIQFSTCILLHSLFHV